MTRLEMAIDQIRATREYTLNLLAQVEPDRWFRMPAEGVTHIAWQAGHLAMAEYRLALERIRGARPEDADLIAPEFLARFGKGSAPSADASQYPTPSEIMAVLARIHEQAMRELPSVADSDLDQPPLKPHVLFNTKLGSLQWCVRHESIHAGQIALLRGY